MVVTRKISMQQQQNIRLTSSTNSKFRVSSVVVYAVFLIVPFFGLFIVYLSFKSAIPKHQFLHEPNNNNNILHNAERSDDVHDDVGTTDAEYHVVFSTGCSLYQDWQSYVFFYQALLSKQPGTITRIVSGCEDTEQRKSMEELFQKEIRSMTPNITSTEAAGDRFQIHFTPDYSKQKKGIKYVYFNKPFGMKHWLENRLGFPNKPINENSIIILMDPDQVIMRPFTANNFSNTLWKFIPPNIQPRVRIEHGKPMGQLYGFGTQWKTKINMTQILLSVNTSIRPGTLASLVSPIDKLSHQQAQAGYIVGPPYIATARDMYKIVTVWSDFVVPVHDQYPHLLAEMFAYSLAAAHLELSHQTAISFMISDISMGSQAEGWSFIDSMPLNKICTRTYTIDEIPNVLHFCQRYGIDEYFFGKHRLPKDILSCEAPLLKEPPTDILLDSITSVQFPGGEIRNFTKQNDMKRNAFVICYLLPAVNMAATYYKQRHCYNSSTTSVTANFNKVSLGID